MTTTLLRYSDLQASGIVRNREGLRQLIANEDFPPGWLLSPNRRVWDQPIVDQWLQRRRDEASRNHFASASSDQAA